MPIILSKNILGFIVEQEGFEPSCYLLQYYNFNTAYDIVLYLEYHSSFTSVSFNSAEVVQERVN